MSRFAAFELKDADLHVQAPGVSYVLSSDLTVLYWSKEAARLYGYTAEFALGKSFRELTAFEICGETEMESWERLIKEGVWQGLALHRRADRSTLRVTCRIEFVHDLDGNINGVAVRVDPAPDPSPSRLTRSSAA